MNYGIYLNTAGALAEGMRQDVLANNIANINTTGFKSDRAVFRSRLNEAMSRSDMTLSTADPSARPIGGGVYINEVSHSTKIGALQASDRPFDLAMQGVAISRWVTITRGSTRVTDAFSAIRSPGS